MDQSKVSVTNNVPATPKRRRWPKVLLTIFIVLGGFVIYMSTVMSPNVEHGQPMPSAELTRLEGGAFDLASLRGKHVLLDFWSST